MGGAVGLDDFCSLMLGWGIWEGEGVLKCSFCMCRCRYEHVRTWVWIHAFGGLFGQIHGFMMVRSECVGFCEEIGKAFVCK